MSFTNKIAIVTGAASGIGLELARGLSRRGAHVVVSDIDGPAADRAAAEIPNAEAATVDVTDAAAVRDLVDVVEARHDRIDLLFNNAGIAIFGETEDMSLDDWRQIVAINIQGVVNGVAAAYPKMIERGSGHIVNTASLAGLAPTPGGTAYSMTKHAVVGLSTSLRSEASRFGVRVSAACPGFIDTPIKEHMKLLSGIDREQAMAEFPFKLHPQDYCAEVILHGVERNRAIITVTALARFMWLWYRYSPRSYQLAMNRVVGDNPLLREASS